MKKSIVVLSVIFSFLAFASANANSIQKENCKQCEAKAAQYAAEEEAFALEITEGLHAKYAKAIEASKNQIDKVVVLDSAGKTIKEISPADHQTHEAELPVGAEKLMVRHRIAYYIVL